MTEIVVKLGAITHSTQLALEALSRSTDPVVAAAVRNGLVGDDLILPLEVAPAVVSAADALRNDPSLDKWTQVMVKDIAIRAREAAERSGVQVAAVEESRLSVAPVSRPLASKPEAGFKPKLGSYDTVIVTFSGGKDSLASLIRTLELAKEQGRDLVADNAVELWHEDVDSPESGQFMDWPVTAAYVNAVGEAFGIPVYFQWKVGGYKRELLKKDERTEATKWQEPGGKIGVAGGERGKIGTRRMFPQVSPDLRVRWCSAYLKIDPCSKAIANQERFMGKRTLVVSGERAEESPGRARYEVFEPDRTNLESGRRRVDRWRPVHHWTTAQVWEAIRRAGVVAHPAYRAGFGRVSCAFCIFASEDQLATARELMPEAFREIVRLERSFGSTIKRDKRSFDEWADAGTSYAVRDADVAEGRRLAVLTTYDAPVLVDPKDWVLPLGAFAEGAGPT